MDELQQFVQLYNKLLEVNGLGNVLETTKPLQFQQHENTSWKLGEHNDETDDGTLVHRIIVHDEIDDIQFEP